MSIQDPLFQGERICFAPIDPEKDSAVEASWTRSAEFLRMLGPQTARPQTAFEIKKKYEAIENEIDEKHTLAHFMIHLKEANPDDSGAPGPAGQVGRLIGFARIENIEWSHGTAGLRLAIGLPEDRGQGYGAEALRMLLRYAFHELNLYRVSAVIPGYNQAAIALARKAGFVEEVRRREAIHRDGRYWDLVHYGLLQEEWKG